MDLYLLPGLGTDRRLFSRLDLAGHEVHYLEWPSFGPDCSIPGIAQQLVAQVDATRPHILVGVSMGGMVAQELAQLTRPERVLLISSVTGPAEYPRLLRISAMFQLHRLITDATVRITWPMRRFFGVRDGQVSRLLCAMAYDQGGTQIRRGTGAILRWRGSPWQGSVWRIHGDADRVLPMRFPVDHVVQGATHPMVITRGPEISRALIDVLGHVLGTGDDASSSRGMSQP